jgi:hypothetical protein
MELLAEKLYRGEPLFRRPGKPVLKIRPRAALFRKGRTPQRPLQAEGLGHRFQYTIR